MKEGDIYILNFSHGILNGPCTYFPKDTCYAFVIYFEINRFKKVIKKFHFSEKTFFNSKIQIIKKLFEDS